MNKEKIQNSLRKVREQIKSSYSGDKRKNDIALSSLYHCEIWAMSNNDWQNQESAKLRCREYVKSGLKKDSKYGSILASIFIPIIIKLISEWIINKFINSLYEN